MGNQERNTFVCHAMTETLLDMLQTRKLNEIGIGELAKKAGVSRNSFYRNFGSKEAILRRRIRTYLDGWKKTADHDKSPDPKHLYALLFYTAEQHRDFFLLLKKAGLLYLLQDEFFAAFGPAEEDDDIAAYSKAFFAYSTFGFLETWIRRGMRQTASEMESLLEIRS
ncbi:MAG: TetR/AcrR family transcriptional regulator [Clostridiales bacterium]|nr:TetR/AcrR family transcriptional regulator [Clostridiales bacterium]